MKTISLIIFIIVTLWAASLTFNYAKASAEWNQHYGNYWDLADKSSTIERKSEFIDKFVIALENANLKDSHDALIFFTPSNSFEQNFEALKSLRNRLNQIKQMDISSFQYQTAIQQITAQEQGEAQRMIGTIESCWFKQNHFFLWGAIGASQVIILILVGFINVVMILANA